MHDALRTGCFRQYHRDLHAMGRLYTKLELDRPATKKVGNRDLKIPSRGAFVLRNKMVAVSLACLQHSTLGLYRGILQEPRLGTQ